MRKSNHSKKIVKQLKREYKEDLEKSGNVKQEIKSGLKIAYTPIWCHMAFKQIMCQSIFVCMTGESFATVIFVDASPQPAVAIKEEVASKGSSDQGEEEMEVDSADDHDTEAKAQGGRAQSRTTRKDNGAAFNTLSSLSSLRPGNTATQLSLKWKTKGPVFLTWSSALL